jgi:DNA polymerase I-like protein with 3'-5' exonuclease and polymerase domains
MEFRIVECLTELGHLVPTEPVFADTETDGLYLAVRTIQLYQPATSDMIYIIDTDILDIDEAKELLKPLWTIWQGANYDFGTLNMTTERYDDTLLLARTAYPEWTTMKCDKGSKAFSLDTIVKRLKLEYLYEELDKSTLQKAGFVKGAYLSQMQLRYAATDVLALSLIWENKKIQAARELMCYKVDMLSLKYVIEYQQNNLIVDQKNVLPELEKLVAIIGANDKELNGLNPNSPKQVKEFLGTESSDKITLVRLISEGGQRGHIAKIVFEQRRLLKRRTFLNSYNFPYVTTRFNPAGAVTGRFTSTGGDLPRGINAQQITRNLQYLFNSDTEDTVVVHADYSTAELRAACSIMRDATMYKELKEGIDLHKVAANMATDIPVSEITKADRQKGKAVSFGLIFGMSAASFVEYAFTNYGVIFTLEEAKLIKYKYQQRYKNIAQYHSRWWNDYKTVYPETPLGRRTKARLGTDAINHATQGCIGDTMKLALHYLCKDYPEATKYIYNVVHDAGYLRVPKINDEFTKLWADRLVDAMKKGWVEMCKTPMLFYKDIPMPVEVEYTCYDSGEATEAMRKIYIV